MALSEEAWDEMFAGLASYLWALAGKLIDEPRRLPLYEKTIVDALRDRARFEGETAAAMKAWLTGIMRNDAIDLARSRDRGPVEVSLDDSSEPATCAEVLLGALDARSTGPQTRAAALLDLARALRALPEGERACIVLYLLEDLTVPEIAQRLGRPESTVKKACYRAARRMREHLGLALS